MARIEPIKLKNGITINVTSVGTHWELDLQGKPISALSKSQIGFEVYELWPLQHDPQGLIAQIMQKRFATYLDSNYSPAEIAKLITSFQNKIEDIRIILQGLYKIDLFVHVYELFTSKNKEFDINKSEDIEDLIRSLDTTPKKEQMIRQNLHALAQILNTVGY